MQKPAINKQGRMDRQWGWGEKTTRMKERTGNGKKGYKNIAYGSLGKGEKNNRGKDGIRNEGKRKMKREE